jgi:hypothetical protein
VDQVGERRPTSGAAPQTFGGGLRELDAAILGDDDRLGRLLEREPVLRLAPLRRPGRGRRAGSTHALLLPGTCFRLAASSGGATWGR